MKLIASILMMFSLVGCGMTGAERDATEDSAREIRDAYVLQLEQQIEQLEADLEAERERLARDAVRISRLQALLKIARDEREAAMYNLKAAFEAFRRMRLNEGGS